jgi:hypothetical protein
MTTDEFMTVLKRNPISFGCGALTLALAVGIYFRSGAIPETEAELQQKSAEAERYALNIKSAAQLKEQVDRITAANKTIESHMVHVNQLAINQQYFQVLRRDTGVNLVDFRQATMSANVVKGGKNAYMPVAFSLVVQGTLAQTLNFLRALENGTHYCRVMAATCAANPNSRNAPLTLSLTLELLGVP